MCHQHHHRDIAHFRECYSPSWQTVYKLTLAVKWLAKSNELIYLGLHFAISKRTSSYPVSLLGRSR